MNLAATLTLDNARFQKPMGEAIRATRDLRDASGQMSSALATAASGAGLGAVAVPAAAAVTSMAMMRRELANVGRDIRSTALGPMQQLRTQFAGLTVDLAGGGRGGRGMKNVTPLAAMRSELILLTGDMRRYIALQDAAFSANGGPGGASLMVHAPIGRLISNRGVTTGAAGAARGAAGAGAMGGMGGIGAMLGRFTLPGIIGTVAAVTGGAAISAASEMEGFKASFVTLLGSVDAAEKRLADLAKFADSTPFELPEVVQASRVLETLTQGALSTGEGLAMVGNIAAVTQQPIGDLAMWVGRLYDGLQSGRPVGEAMMRLQELGVMSGDVRGKIEALQESGKKGDVVWQTAAASFSRFSGEMERKSQTAAGKLSTMSDAAKGLGRELGEIPLALLKGPMDMATQGMGGLARYVKEVKSDWAALLGLKAPPEWQAPKKAAAAKEPLIPMADALEGAFGKLDRFSAARAEMKSAFSELRMLNEQRVLNDPFSSDATRQRTLEARSRRLFAETQLDEVAPGVRVNPGSIDATAERLREELAIAEAMAQHVDLAEQAAVKIAALLPIYKEILEIQQQSNALKAQAVDAALKDFFDPLDKKSATMAGSKVAPVSEIAGDRLARIGGVIGSGGPANDYARRSATATEKLVGLMQTMTKMFPGTNFPQSGDPVSGNALSWR